MNAMQATWSVRRPLSLDSRGRVQRRRDMNSQKASTPTTFLSEMAESGLDASFIPSLHKPSALLPIAKHRGALLYLVETNPVAIVVGHTGSGKTTQIPQFLEKAGWCADGKLIGVTQVSLEG